MRITFSRQAGVGQLSFFAMIAAIGLLMIGGYGVYIAYRNPTPRYIGYDDFVQTKPAVAWLCLTNCTLDLPAAVYKYGIADKKVKSLTVPVLGTNANKIAHVMLVTEDPVLMGVYKEILGLSEKSAEAALKWIATNPQHAYPKQDVRGLVQFNSPSRPSPLSNSTGTRLADKVYFINDAKKPNMETHIAMLVTGLVVLAIMIKRAKNAEAED